MKEKSKEEILKEHYKATEEVAERIIRELKKKSNDFGQLRVNINRLKAGAYFELGGEKRYSSLFNIINEKVEEEIRDIKLS